MEEEVRCEEVCKALCEEQQCEVSCSEEFCSGTDSLWTYVLFILLAMLILAAIVRILWPKASTQPVRGNYHSL
jgi:hypothetical protein